MKKKTYFKEFNVESGNNMYGEYILVKDQETDEIVGSVYYAGVPNDGGTSIFYIGYGDKLHPEQDQDKIQDIKSRYPRIGIELFKWVRKNLPQPYYAAFANQDLKRTLRAEPTGMEGFDIITGEPISVDIIRRSNRSKKMSSDKEEKVDRVKKELKAKNYKEYNDAMADLWESVSPGMGQQYKDKYHSPQKSKKELDDWAKEELKKIDSTGRKTKALDNKEKMIERMLEKQQNRRKSSVNLTPPEGVRSAARRGIKYHSEGKAGDGFESATLTRAHKIADGQELTPEHVKRMHSFFERHAGGRSEKAGKGEVTPWDVAWLAWGGNAGRSWAASKVKELENEKKSSIEKRISNIKKKLGKDCNCWEGYKRVPGTEPCAPGSCEKCDSDRKSKKKKK